jgi:hypothetical protein
MPEQNWTIWATTRLLSNARSSSQCEVIRMDVQTAPGCRCQGLRDFLPAGWVLQIPGQVDVAQPAKDRGAAVAICGDEDVTNSACHSLLSISQ